ncbi:ABC transporter permease [Candidatus Daviesbacteria bacterium]|nr:ABC transporter permease [Candidatus Daviesbacteria bacterium]
MSRTTFYAKRNIRRTPFQAIAASMVMFLTFFALTSFLLLAAGSQATLRFFESKPQVIAFFKEGTTDSDISTIENALKQDPRVINTKFVSKEEALKKYQRDNKNDPMLLELVTANILPPSIEVSTKNPEDLSAIAQILTKEPVIEQTFIPKDVIRNLTYFTTTVRLIGSAIVIFLLIFSLLIILMIIGFKIRIRRNEIEIMRLLGASTSFIRNPFILEGVFYGLIGAILAWVVSYGILWYFTPFLQGYLGEVRLLPVNPYFMLILLGTNLLIACFVGALGSFGAVRRYLKI